MKNIIKKLFLFIFVPMLVLAGFSSWVIVQEETIIVGKYPYSDAKVAYIEGEESIIYSTLGQALDVAETLSASENVNVIILPGVTLEITSTITVKTNVNLYIPYSLNYDSNGKCVGMNWETKKDELVSMTLSGFADSSATKVASNRKTLINLKNGADIIVENGASLNLGGQCKTTGVVGSYSEINLDSGSMIDCYGDFYCYGYVKENAQSYKNGNQQDFKNYSDNSFDEGRMIRVNSGGKLKSPVGMYDMKAATTLMSLNDVDVFPLNIFDFPCLQTYTEVYYGASFIAKTYLVATSSTNNLPVYEDLPVLNKDSAIFNLKNGIAAFEYCPGNINYTSNTGLTKLFINGEVVQGSATLKIGTGIGSTTVPISTDGKFLPLSYKFNLYINNGGSYRTDQKVKCLPGFKFKINKGGKANINNEIIFYEGSFGSKIGSYSNSTDAVLINNGTINLEKNGKIGAFIQTESNDDSAVLNFESVSSSDAFVVNSVEGVNAVEVVKTSEGYFMDESENGKSLYQFVAGSKVCSDVDGSKCWVGEKYALRKISINIEETTFETNIFSYEILISDDSSGSTYNQVTSGVQTTAGEYEVPYGKYVRINVTRHNTAFFSDGTQHSSSDWYYVDGDMDLSIVPNEGVSLSVQTEGKSGNGQTTITVYEIDNQNNKYELASYTALGSKAVVKVVKNWKFNIEAEESFLSGLAAETELDPANYTITNSAGDSSKFSTGKDYLADDNYSVFLPRKEKGGSCLVEGTLITMADGTQKAVEDIVPGDMLKVFNHENGTFDIAPVVFNDFDAASNYVIIKLEFSNDRIVKVVTEHGFFDLDLMKYVYIDQYNYDKYVGHRFYADNGNVITLENAYLTEEIVKVYSPVTAYHLNYFTEGVLSMPGGIEGLFNIFEYDDDLSYNEQSKQSDINTYGLFTYEDFEEYTTYEFYSAFPTEYLKVSIGKGYITFEEILYLIERYQPKTE